MGWAGMKTLRRGAPIIGGSALMIGGSYLSVPIYKLMTGIKRLRNDATSVCASIRVASMRRPILVW